MRPLYEQYLDCPLTYATYDDFNKRFRIKRPESFNFAFDVADRIADEDPDRLALLWTDEERRLRILYVLDAQGGIQPGGQLFPLAWDQEGAIRFC